MVSKAEPHLFVAQFLKFTGVGVLGTLAHYIVLVALVQLLTANAVVASSLGAIIGAIVNYCLNYHYTFESSKRHADAISKFFSVATVGFILNGLSMTLLTEKLSIHYLIAQIITTGAILIWNFLGNRFWTFRDTNRGLIMENIPVRANKNSHPINTVKNTFPLSSIWQNNPKFVWILGLAACFLFWSVWWGWPLSFDQHDPTKSAIKMLSNRTLDPGKRYWGAFAYQEVLAFSVIPVAVLKKALSLDPELSKGLMFLMTRVLWALKALAVVIMTYWTSMELFKDRRAALIAMFFIAVSPGYIAWAHIPQVDIVHTFWFCLAVLLTALGWSRRNMKFLFCAAIAAGLAASVKYIGGVIVLAPIVVTLMRFRFRQAALFGCLLMFTALFVFFVTTPLASGSPLQWFPEYTADVLANQHRELDKPIAFWTMPLAIADLLGPGTVAFGLITTLFFFSKGNKKYRDSRAWMVLIACFLPYYLVLSWQHVSTVRYVLPLISVITVAVGAITRIALNHSRAIRPLTFGLFLVGLIQITLSTALAVGFSTDTRQRLLLWLEDNTEPSDQVETILSHRPFFVASPSFGVVNRPHFQAETYQMKRHIAEDRDSAIRRLHELLVRQAGKNPETFLTWVDRERVWLGKRAKTFDTGINGPVKRHSKYIVVNLNTAHFYILDWPGVDPQSPNEKEFIRALLTESGPYKQVAKFDPVVPSWLRYPRELWFNVSPPVAVFQVVPPIS